MDSVKKLKRGETLFKEGDAPAMVYIVQSGKVGLMIERSGKKLEIVSLGASQILGEQCLFSTARHAFGAEALQETKLLEVPLEIMKQQFEKAPPGIKLLVKSLVDEIKVNRQAMKASKMETEKVPCPQGLIHRLFTEVHLIARHIGKKNPDNANEVTLSWNAIKLYASRFFGESPARLRSILDVLAKLKMAELKIGKSEETGEEELIDVKLLQLQVCEDFAEFYQYHLFKGSRAEAIYVDPLALKVAKALVELSVEAPVDHKGASKLDYALVLNECKTKYRIDLKNTHLDALEKKGLFVTRKSYDDGRVELAFDRNEFVKMAHFWAIIYEIDKWNDKGSVDMHEKEEVAAAGGGCPQCNGAIDNTHKFCPHCGAKVSAAA